MTDDQDQYPLQLLESGRVLRNFQRQTQTRVFSKGEEKNLHFLALLFLPSYRFHCTVNSRCKSRCKSRNNLREFSTNQNPELLTENPTNQKKILKKKLLRVNIIPTLVSFRKKKKFKLAHKKVYKNV